MLTWVGGGGEENCEGVWIDSEGFGERVLGGEGGVVKGIDKLVVV
jgi:hypothetical protein